MDLGKGKSGMEGGKLTIFVDWLMNQGSSAILTRMVTARSSLGAKSEIEVMTRYQSFYLELSHFNAQVIEDVLFLENWNPLPFLVVPPNYKAGPLLSINIQKDQGEKEKANFVAFGQNSYCSNKRIETSTYFHTKCSELSLAGSVCYGDSLCETPVHEHQMCGSMSS